MTECSAARMRRLRARRALGLRVVPVPVSIDAIQALIEAGLVDGPRDEDAIAQALAELVEEHITSFARDASRPDSAGW